MKIILLGTAYPYRGGLATFNERLARQFIAEGHEVELWTFTLQYPSFLFPGKTQYSSEQSPKGITIRRILNSCNPFSWFKTAYAVRKAAPDILICCYWMAFFAPAYGLISHIAKRNGKTRSIALVHNMMPHEPSLVDRLLAPYFVHNTDAFVALSKSVIHDIDKIDNCRKPKIFSPHPIYDHYGDAMPKETACQALSLPSDKQYMLFFGLVRAYKGLDILLDAFALVKDRLPDLNLIIAGEFYEDEEKYRNQIVNNGLTNRVILRNEFIADADLPKYFGVADIVVQPYRSATQSGVTQVAFHFEKPMLVTNVGGLGEIVHDHKMGYACSPDPVSIASAIADYFTNSRQAPFTDYLIREKSKYSWSRLTDAFLTILS